ncbi:peptidyl-prolyl cis-trans isomerase [Aureimonas leprariae]|nr:peptidyl-prolyl cis-trans isomerase [Aureimonas leprariae]
MLKTLRNKTSGLIAKGILGLVVVGFVVTGFAGFFQGGQSTTVVSAGRTKLGFEDYLLAWRQFEVVIARQLQRRPTKEEAVQQGIEQRVLSQLITDAALDEQARRLDLGMSEERLAQLISEDPSFHNGTGNFSRDAFRQFLNGIGMSENGFIRNRQRNAASSQLVDAVARGATAPLAVRTAFGLYSDERRTVDYLTIPTASVEPIAEPAPDALAKYFDTNKQRYRAPEYRAVDYVLLTPEALSDPAAVTDEDVQREYDRAKSRYTTPERRQVQQLLFSDAAAATAARAQLAGGTPVEQLAAAANGQKPSVSDLGLRAKSEIRDKSIADAAFALQPGQVSEVVNGAFGPALLRILKTEPEVVKPLDEVRDDVRQRLALQIANDEVQQARNTFDDARAGGATLKEAAQRAGVALKSVPAVSRVGEAPDEKPVADLPQAEGFLDGVFAADIGAENPVIDLQPSGALIYEVTKIDPARDRTLDDVRAKVVADWKSDEAQRLVGERATELKKRLDGGESLDAIASAEKLTKETAPAVTRQTASGQLGGEGAEKAFAGKEGLTAIATGPDGASRLLMRVASVAPPIDPLKSIKDSDADQLDQYVQNDLLQSYVDGLRQDLQVVPHPQAIAQIQASVR